MLRIILVYKEQGIRTHKNAPRYFKNKFCVYMDMNPERVFCIHNNNMCMCEKNIHTPKCTHIHQE